MNAAEPSDQAAGGRLDRLRIMMLLQGAPRLCIAWGIRLALLALLLIALLGDAQEPGTGRYVSLDGVVGVP